MATNLLLWSLGLLTLAWLGAEAARSGFYVDNEFRQTVLVADLPNNHKRAIKQQLLDLLGLQRRPKPSKSGDADSAPHYMLDLYRTLEEEQGAIEELERVRESVRRKCLTLPGMERDIGEADMITSFVNHGMAWIPITTETEMLFWQNFTTSDAASGAKIEKKAIILTTVEAVSDENLAKMTTFLFQWIKTELSWRLPSLATSEVFMTTKVAKVGIMSTRGSQ